MLRYQHPRRLLMGALLATGLTLGSATPTAASITPLGQQGCAAGTVVGGPNLVVNGDFSQGSTGFTSQLPDAGTGPDGLGVFPDDNAVPLAGGFSIQTGPRTYSNGFVVGRPFPGDPQREAPAAQTYFYSNVNEDKSGAKLYGPGTAGRAMLWRQVVPVVQNTTYNFYAYFDNLIAVDNPFFADPKIELRVNGVVAGPAIVVDKFPDAWIPIQFTFTTGPGQTTAALEIYDLANNTAGDDFGLAQISLKQCVTSIGAAKAALPPVDNGNGTYTVEFLFTLKNLGVDPLPLTKVQIVDDLSQTFANAASFSVVSLSSPTLTVNPSYNGSSDKRLLSGNDQLAARQRATVTLKVRVSPGTGAGGTGPFLNKALISAMAGAVAVEDDSAPGTNPDPDGDGDPKEPPEDRGTPIYLKGRPLFIPIVRR